MLKIIKLYHESTPRACKHYFELDCYPWRKSLSWRFQDMFKHVYKTSTSRQSSWMTWSQTTINYDSCNTKHLKKATSQHDTVKLNTTNSISNKICKQTPEQLATTLMWSKNSYQLRLSIDMPCKAWFQFRSGNYTSLGDVIVFGWSEDEVQDGNYPLLSSFHEYGQLLLK